MKVSNVSQLSGKTHTLELDVTVEQLQRIENRYISRELIQNIVPHLSSSEREFLMTGITQQEWVEIYGEEE